MSHRRRFILEGINDARSYIQSIPELSLYVVTVVTMYYNEFDNTMLPVYHVLSQFFGYGFQALIFGFICAVYLRFNLRSWFSLIGLLVYEIQNLTYSLMVLIYGETSFDSTSMETYSMWVFSLFVSSLYFEQWRVKVQSILIRWKNL